MVRGLWHCASWAGPMLLGLGGIHSHKGEDCHLHPGLWEPGLLEETALASSPPGLLGPALGSASLREEGRACAPGPDSGTRRYRMPVRRGVLGSSARKGEHSRAGVLE